ncbi:MAG: NUDIX hydrolase [Patescibacteria group bacterium]
MTEIQIKIGVLIQKNDSLLLIKEKYDQNRAYRWNIIKGTFEPEADKNIITAAKRESEEEAGACVDINHILNIFFLKRKNKLTIQFNFLASLTKETLKISDKKEQKQREENIAELRFFNKEELKKIKKEEFINTRAYLAVQDWIEGKRYNLELLQILSE